jgi:glycosyltransferase involved in cell wall biosynthesis
MCEYRPNTPNTIDISIVVPIYNSESCLAECIESITRQDFRNIEIILVNDGSTDNSGYICDSYAQTDPRITIIHQENRGRIVAREIGTKTAKGEWVTYVDSDDTLPHDAMSNLHKAIEDKVDIVLGNGYTLQGESRMTIPLDEFRHMAVRADGCIGVPWGTLYRRSVITHYLFDLPREFYMGEDYIFWLRLIFLTEKPVNIVYESVYNKKNDTTSASFVWTADYALLINKYRKSSIPKTLHSLYLNDMIDDAICNLISVAQHQHKRHWRKSLFYKDILADMKQANRRFTSKQLLFLHLPYLPLRQFVAKIVSWINHLS